MNPNWYKYDDLFKESGITYDVQWTWLKAISLNESNLGVNVSVAAGLTNPQDLKKSVSSDGLSYGLMQLTLSTAKSLDMLSSAEKLNDPAYSIDLGAHYIQLLKKMFDPTELKFMEWVVKSYNQGPGNTKKERAGKIFPGYSDKYWAKFQVNLELVLAG